MENFDIKRLLGLESDSDKHVSNPLEGSSDIFNPLNLFPNPLLSGIPTSSSPNQTSIVSAALTEEEATHIDNLLYFGVDSPILPPDILTSAVASAEMPPALAPVLPRPSIQPTASSVSPLPVIISPATASMAPSVPPPTHKRRHSLVDEPIQSQPQEPTPGPSEPRPAKRWRICGSLVDEPIQPQVPSPSLSDLRSAKRPCIRGSLVDELELPRAPTPGPSRPQTGKRPPFPGESLFQLDPTVAASLRPSTPVDRPAAKPRPSPDHSQCQCPTGSTQKPGRHWDSCPYNPDAGQKPFDCEICGKCYTTKSNKERHVKDKHPQSLLGS
ncbi:hypothetical protein FRC04_010217 [Tulasnella sp. 424]|nr:hypothetical protein FRC04_010217 [Tulasnella sp. 424]KAG8966411.1 hypothetical protein FRC05_002657 [Tulasnella sp. 425]